MHAFSHSLAHRAPPATRTRVRWQPYSNLSSQSASSTTSSKSPSSQVSTPSSSLTSPPSNTPFPETKQCNLSTQNHKESPPPRDPIKNKYAVGLVDQAVKTLSEIWRPQDIPSVFLASSRPGAALSPSVEPSSCKILTPSHRSTSCISTASMPLILASSACKNEPRGCVVPIKGFVHEVIRRSRTSGCVLQTALCYLEAIRPKVPDLLRKEQSGQGMQDPGPSTRISPATDLELKIEGGYLEPSSFSLGPTPTINSDDMAPTVRIEDIGLANPPLPAEESQNMGSTEQSPPPPPVLPSPLLCPRRTFLAALILASKFTQDKCYSNRAWAKLSGLPAREIGRCERALGEALEWRLWVGKTPVQSQPSVSPTINNPASRPVARSQSESNILSLPSTRSPFLVRPDTRHPPVLSNTQRVLRRNSTMPSESFQTPSSVWSPADARTLPLKCAQQSLNGLPASSTAVVPHSFADTLCQSPSPDNPGLSYSPTSTESSSGDRTIQMTTFLDEPMAMCSLPHAPAAAEFWPWSDNNDTSQDFRMSPLATARNNQMAKVPMVFDNSFIIPGATIIEQPSRGAIAVAPNMLWSAEGEILRPPLLTQ